MSAPGPQRTRRWLLRSGVAVGLIALVGGPIAVLRSRGYAIVTRTPLVALTTWQAVVVAATAARVLAPDRTDDPNIPTPGDVDVVGFVDRCVASLAPYQRRDFGRLLAYLEHLAPLVIYESSRFTRLPFDRQDAVLRAFESSDIVMLRGAFQALKSLIVMGYYRDPRTWVIAEYDGPWVDRPAGGWR